MQNKSRAYIFDMDGTLICNTRYHVIAWLEFARRHGGTITEKQIIDWMGAPARYYCQQMFPGLSADDYQKMTHEKEVLYREIYKPHMRLADGLRDLLDRAHAANIPCAVATGGTTGNVNFILDGLSIRGDFAAIIDAGCYTRGKPEPDCYLEAANALKIAPKDCIVFEDAIAGIHAAQAAGMQVIAITSTSSREILSTAHPTRIIDSFTELKQLP